MGASRGAGRHRGRAASSCTPPRTCRRSWTLCAAGGGAIDADTFVGEASFRGRAARCRRRVRDDPRADGAASAESGFCAVRPSGHHAERNARWASACSTTSRSRPSSRSAELGARRVFDPGLGRPPRQRNGGDLPRRADVLYASIHQSGLVPGHRRARRRRLRAKARATRSTCPCPAGSDEELWLSMLVHVLLPAAARVRARPRARIGRLRRPRRGSARRLPAADRARSRRWRATCVTWRRTAEVAAGGGARGRLQPARARASACARRSPRSPARRGRAIGAARPIEGRPAAHLASGGTASGTTGRSGRVRRRSWSPRAPAAQPKNSSAVSYRLGSSSFGWRRASARGISMMAVPRSATIVP